MVSIGFNFDDEFTLTDKIENLLTKLSHVMERLSRQTSIRHRSFLHYFVIAILPGFKVNF